MLRQYLVIPSRDLSGIQISPIREERLLEGLSIKKVFLHKVVIALRVRRFKPHILIQINRRTLTEVQITLPDLLI